MTAPASCPACRAALVAEARYCHRCGRAATAGGATERAPWLIAWSLVFVAVAGIAYFVLTKDTTPDRPEMSNTGASGGGPAGGAGSSGAPPDISQMSPSERFLRLHDRIMQAAERGDTATVSRFAPMAITAYGMLDRVDPDLRFHAGSIHARLGDYQAALALADTIAAEAPGHLLADMLRAMVAEARGDQAMLRRSRQDFLARYDQQMASGRPEYEEHRAMLEDFRRKAR